MTRFEINPTCTIVISPLINLIIHTFNMYDMLGGMGGQYELKSEPEAKKAVLKKYYKILARNEQYFGFNANLYIFEPLMHKCIDTSLYAQTPTTALLKDITDCEPFNRAITHMWETYYKKYWQDTSEAFTRSVKEVYDEYPWKKTIEKMELYSGAKFQQTVYIFPTRATGQSALEVAPNIVIGNAYPHHDLSFTHEGFHILLGEKWADQPVLKEKMQGFNEIGGWGPKWQAKYEQALVVSLDSSIKNLTEDQAKSYFYGCNVGDLFDKFWPSIHKITKESMSVNDFMRKMIAG